ncbi:hypothetical protein AJ87_20100 [Rhizobium yanglingense]|nr:hypothetical protein AJ87_20100 [Rhizobium yanglingense]
MSRAEVAVAKSHIEVWRRIAQGTQKYALILEDDVWFHPGFARQLDQAWKEATTASGGYEGVDILYVSYMEVTNGAPKSFISSNVFSRCADCGICRDTSFHDKAQKSFFVYFLAEGPSIFDQPGVQRLERISNEAQYCPPKNRYLLNQLVLNSSDPI